MTTVPSFSQAQARRLVEFLAMPERPEGTMRYCELAGFLFAVACSPEMVQPSEWLPLVFNGQEGNFKDLAEAQKMLPAILALYNHVNRGVLDREPVLPPGCEARAEPMANLEPDAPLSLWARGFGNGHGWLEKVWDEYVPKEFDEEIGANLMVLSFFASRGLAEAYRKEAGLGDKPLEAVAREMLGLLPNAVKSYARLGRSIGEALREPHLERRGPGRSGKIGRNDPCPCGSGKKYKKCCGSRLH